MELSKFFFDLKILCNYLQKFIYMQNFMNKITMVSWSTFKSHFFLKLFSHEFWYINRMEKSENELIFSVNLIWIICIWLKSTWYFRYIIFTGIIILSCLMWDFEDRLVLERPNRLKLTQQLPYVSWSLFIFLILNYN